MGRPAHRYRLFYEKVREANLTVYARQGSADGECLDIIFLRLGGFFLVCTKWFYVKRVSRTNFSVVSRNKYVVRLLKTLKYPKNLKIYVCKVKSTDPVFYCKSFH